MDEGKKNPLSETIQDIVDAVGNLDALKPKDDSLTDFVEWVVVHKGCGKPLTGHSPRNGYCYCLVSTGMPPGVKQIMGWKLEDCEAYAAGYEAAKAEVAPAQLPPDALAFKAKHEEAEKEIASLREKLDKASKKIAELVKKQ